MVFGGLVMALALCVAIEGVLELASFRTPREPVAILGYPLIYEASDEAKWRSFHYKPQPPPVKLRLV